MVTCLDSTQLIAWLVAEWERCGSFHFDTYVAPLLWLRKLRALLRFLISLLSLVLYSVWLNLKTDCSA